MPRVALAVCLALAWSPATSGQARLAPGEPIPSAELESFVDGLVHQAMAAGHIAGAAVSVVQGGRSVLNKGYGFADVATGRRVDPDTTLFRIGSINKTFTWIALLNAVEAGRMALDDPVNRHLPPDLQIPDGGFAEPIRLRHLMTHSAGFEDLMFGHLFVADPARVRPLAAYLRDHRPRRVREPGRVHSYSNYGVALAGAALEQVHGRSWQHIIEDEILQPLGMRHTSVREPYPARADLPAPMGGLAAALSTGYRWTGVAHEAQAFEYISQVAPAGVISTTAGDMTRYMLMILGDGAFDGVAVFHAAAALDGPMSTLPAAVGNWTAGFLEWRQPGGFRSIGHDGGSLLFFSNMTLVPQLDLGVFATTNTAGGDGLTGTLASRIIERFYAAPAPAPRGGSPDLRAAAPVYEGFYLQTRRAYSGVQGFLFRLLARQVRVDGDGYLVAGLMGPPQRFVPASGPDQFTSVEPAGFAQGLRFTREGGLATRIETPFMGFERVALLRRPPALALATVVTILFSMGTLVRPRVRFRREVSRSRAERWGAALQTLAALGWLTAAVAFGLFAQRAAADESTLFYAWPAPSLLTFSTTALVAGMLAAGMVALLPALWRHGGGWTVARKIRYTATALVFAGFAGLLAWWGALQPWTA